MKMDIIRGFIHPLYPSTASKFKRTSSSRKMLENAAHTYPSSKTFASLLKEQFLNKLLFAKIVNID